MSGSAIHAIFFGFVTEPLVIQNKNNRSVGSTRKIRKSERSESKRHAKENSRGKKTQNQTAGRTSQKSTKTKRERTAPARWGYRRNSTMWLTRTNFGQQGKPSDERSGYNCGVNERWGYRRNRTMLLTRTDFGQQEKPSDKRSGYNCGLNERKGRGLHKQGIGMYR